MTPTRRAKFTPPTSAPHAREREVTFGVAGGFHGGVPSQGVPKGFSPKVQNFVPSGDGFITPRSGLSSSSLTISAGGEPQNHGVVLGGWETYNVGGGRFAVASARTNINLLTSSTLLWSRYSYVAGNQSWHAGAVSINTFGYYKAETIYDAVLNANICVFSNNSNSLKWFNTADILVSALTYSDFTWPDSINSTHAAADMTSVSDRLVFFNTTSSAGVKTPTRVMWSARGNPRSFLVADGAGAEDLMEMRGVGQACIRFKDFVLFFSEFDIWRGTPTFDDYVFRFDRVIDGIGTPYPRTVVTTPKGVIFLGRDQEVYITDGVNVAPLGPMEGAGESRIQAKIRGEMTDGTRCWGVYNQKLNRYELYYSIDDSPGDYPSRGLFYDFNTQTWWPQVFTHGLSVGFEYIDPFVSFIGGDGILYDQRTIYTFDSFGTWHRFMSGKTNDSGATIDARWRSPGAKNATRKAHLKEVWIDADVDSASSASVWIGSARCGSVFTSERQVRLTPANDPTFVPVFTTDNAPSFEIRIADGGRPRIASFSATLQDASKF